MLTNADGAPYGIDANLITRGQYAAFVSAEWAGMRLCGAVGGGAIQRSDELDDPDAGEWGYPTRQATAHRY